MCCHIRCVVCVYWLCCWVALVHLAAWSSVVHVCMCLMLHQVGMQVSGWPVGQVTEGCGGAQNVSTGRGWAVAAA